jgi:hypothetical protein
MSCTRIRAPILVASLIAAFVCGASPSVAADWKIDTRVFEGENARPSTTTTTYFHDGVYYDVLGEPAEATIFDRQSGRIALVDMNRRWKTDIETDDLAGLAERFRAAAAAHANEQTRFAAAGKFTVAFDERNAELTLAGRTLVYRVASEKPREARDAEACREFSDWCARLNSVHPGRLPARPRLAVNEELARRGLTPATVRLTLHRDDSAKEVMLRSEHVYTWRLSTDDLVRIAAVKKLPAECKAVSFAEYLGYTANAANETAARR